jgi:hypothetical protein
MRIRIGLILLLTLSANVLADARDGEFMGYRLGGKYQRGSNTTQQVTTTGNLLILAERPLKPGDIAEVALLTTPESLTIGHIAASQWFLTEEEARSFARRYFELLRAKYPTWTYGGEVMDGQMNIVEVSFKELPYNLRLRLTKDLRDGKDMWRFSMTLGWLPDSGQAQAWKAVSAEEQIAARQGAGQQLLKRSDVRGL